MTPAAGEHAGAILGLCRWVWARHLFFNTHHQNTFLTIFARVNSFVGRDLLPLVMCLWRTTPVYEERSRGRQQRVGTSEEVIRRLR
jgi:hypothetical protein